MAKKIIGEVKLQLPAGSANPTPPVGPALGSKGVNIMAFCKDFNAKTKDQSGLIIPVVISIYADRSFTFVLRSPTATILLKKMAGIKKGSKAPNKEKVGKVNRKQIMEIAEEKIKDLNTYNVNTACSMIEGTARSMGIEIIE